jgi:hypothetical protein
LTRAEADGADDADGADGGDAVADDADPERDPTETPT